MFKYRNRFIKLLNEEDEPLNMSDSDAWKDSNEKIVMDPELSKQIDTDGGPRISDSQYTDMFNNLNEQIPTFKKILIKLYKYAASKVTKTGESEIIKELGNLIKDTNDNLNLILSKIELLDSSIKAAIKKEKNAQR